MFVYSMYTHNKYMFDWESKLRSNYEFHRIDKKNISFFFSHTHTPTHTHVYASYTLQRPQWCTRPVYLAQGDSGTDTETKRQVISVMQTVPRVKSDQHQ